MKKTQKKIFGFLGLILVAAVTVFAASLPGPEALANSRTFTDTITVRVVGDTPRVEIIDPVSGGIYVDPNQTINYTYEHVKTVIAVMEYTDSSGVLRRVTLQEFDTTSTYGSETINLDLSTYGYGDYVIRITGTASDGTNDESVINFKYGPVVATVEETPDSDDFYVNLDYDENTNDVDHFEVEVYDENGNLVKPLSPITATPPTKRIDLPFENYNLPYGKYTIKIITYGVSGNILYEETTLVEYRNRDISIPATADTGGLFKNLNISETDYLITGLVIFLIVGVFGLYFIARGKKSSSKK